MYWPDDSVFITGVAKVTKDDAINAMYGTFSWWWTSTATAS